MTRRDLGAVAAAAAVAVFAPAADAKREAWMQAEEYGVRRPDPEPPGPSGFDAVYSTWHSEVGLFHPGPSWASHKERTLVRYATSDGKAPLRMNTTLTLTKLTDTNISLSLAIVAQRIDERTFTRTGAIPSDAKVVEEMKETIEVDGTKYECVARAYEMPGRAFKIWSCKEAPHGFVKVTCGDETTQLVKRSEKVKVAAGEFDCSLWETVVGDTRRQTWRSDKVPGWVVKIDETTNKATTLKVELNTLTEGK